jgi:integrase/recombinase XerD
MHDVLQSYRRDLAVKGYSPKTRKIYYDCVAKFLSDTNKPFDELGKDDVKLHLYEFIKTGKSSSTMNQLYSSIKYLFIQALDKPWEIEGIPRVKKHKTLPAVLSVDETLAILSNAANMKHAAMLMLAYSSGLRVSEVTRTQLIGDLYQKF